MKISIKKIKKRILPTWKRNLFIASPLSHRRKDSRYHQLLNLFYLVIPSGSKFKVLDLSYGGILIEKVPQYKNLPLGKCLKADLMFHNKLLPCHIKVMPPRTNGIPIAFIHDDNRFLTSLREILEFMRLGQSIQEVDPGSFKGDLDTEVKVHHSFHGKTYLSSVHFPTNSGSITINFEEETPKFTLSEAMVEEHDIYYLAMAFLLGIWNTKYISGVEIQINLLFQMISELDERVDGNKKKFSESP